MTNTTTEARVPHSVSPGMTNSAISTAAIRVRRFASQAGRGTTVTKVNF